MCHFFFSFFFLFLSLSFGWLGAETYLLFVGLNRILLGARARTVGKRRLLCALLGGAPGAGAHAVPAVGTPRRKGVTVVLCSLRGSLLGEIFWINFCLSPDMIWPFGSGLGTAGDEHPFGDMFLGAKASSGYTAGAVVGARPYLCLPVQFGASNLRLQGSGRQFVSRGQRLAVAEATRAAVLQQMLRCSSAWLCAHLPRTFLSSGKAGIPQLASFLSGQMLW